MRHFFKDSALGRLAALAAKLGATMMAYVDAQNLYADAQAVTGNVVSTNIIDHGQDRNLGIGEPLVVVVTVDVSPAGGGVLTITLETDDNSGFSSAATIATALNVPAASLAAGSQYVLPVAADAAFERFSRLRFAPTTMTSITVTAFLTRASMVQNAQYYAAGVTVR